MGIKVGDRFKFGPKTFSYFDIFDEVYDKIHENANTVFTIDYYNGEFFFSDKLDALIGESELTNNPFLEGFLVKIDLKINPNFIHYVKAELEI